MNKKLIVAIAIILVAIVSALFAREYSARKDFFVLKSKAANCIEKLIKNGGLITSITNSDKGDLFKKIAADLLEYNNPPTEIISSVANETDLNRILTVRFRTVPETYVDDIVNWMHVINTISPGFYSQNLIEETYKPMEHELITSLRTLSSIDYSTYKAEFIKTSSHSEWNLKNFYCNW